MADPGEKEAFISARSRLPHRKNFQLSLTAISRGHKDCFLRVNLSGRIDFQRKYSGRFLFETLPNANALIYFTPRPHSPPHGGRACREAGVGVMSLDLLCLY